MNYHKFSDWITLNLLNTVYLLKEWVLVQIGVQVSASGIIDKAIAWGVGMTIVIFNIVRIYKYWLDIKEQKKTQDKDDE